MRRIESENGPSKIDVFNAALSGDQEAIEYISLQALGGNEGAKLVIGKIDEMVASGEIKIFNHKPGTKSESTPDIIFVIKHPILSLRTKVRQELVGLDWALPPGKSTIEEFPTLPLQEAAKKFQRQ